jgi:hypothetical protein
VSGEENVAAEGGFDERGEDGAAVSCVIRSITAFETAFG